ncbi:WYL domain-containing protein [Kaistella sp. G5-32]|uniref:WYL domain-containing protein n=1 Tax=Kaistella gelatinilytica TaxID=2787636 RepID=A0ABS0FF30_9FLAO|nr:WYL domain-containing protein [Kaistella gelatinilytica]MBF8458313.1 WYL domain-containing protein [Kaistella gelatinilytica]
MAKRDQMLRLMYISNLLQDKRNIGATYEEVRNHLEAQHYDRKGYDNDLAFSEKTFKRDRNLLFEVFGIETQFKRSTMSYQIIEDENLEQSQGIFENLMLINAYKQTVDHSKIMLFEKRQASGLHHLDGIVHAIKNCKTISLQYKKFSETASHKKVLQPYAVKEFRNRWYLLANEDDGKDFILKTYSLDRITDLDIHNKTFTKKEIDIESLFVNSFGIVSTLGEKPEKIILSFNQNQKGFVKSLPIHHSQKILIDNNEEYQIELTLIPTYDFYQELLTHAERLTIVQPDKVKNKYLEFLGQAMQLNN